VTLEHFFSKVIPLGQITQREFQLKKFILVTASVIALSAVTTAGAFAQSTGPAAQQDNMTKDKMGKDGMKKEGTSGMKKDSMNKDGMKKTGAESKDGDGMPKGGMSK